MTRDEVKSEIVKVKRFCRGPISDEDRKSVNELLARGDQEAANLFDSASRKPCGYDFNKILLKGPFDGEERETECPQCGVKITYSPPIAEDV